MKSKLIALFVGLAVALALSGCATTEAPHAQTQSGKPEVTIATKDGDRIKSEIMAAMITAGYTLDKDSSFMLQFRGPVTAGETFLLGMTVGNSYSSNWRTVSFNFLPVDASTRVIAVSSLNAQLPGGQTNGLDATGKHFDELQQLLSTVKSKVEKTAIASVQEPKS